MGVVRDLWIPFPTFWALEVWLWVCFAGFGLVCLLGHSAVLCMAASALSRFLEAPAIKDLVVFRKAELQAIAEHFQIPVSKQALRPELLQVVRDGMVDRGVLSIEEEEEEGGASGGGKDGPPS